MKFVLGSLKECVDKFRMDEGPEVDQAYQRVQFPSQAHETTRQCLEHLNKKVVPGFDNL